MSEEDINVLVIASGPELATRVNSALRGRGLLVQVEWARDLDDARRQLERTHYELLFGALPECAERALADLSASTDPPLPVIGLAEEVDDDLMERALAAGLRDLVIADRAGHIAAVAKRELQALKALRAVSANRGVVERAEREHEVLFSSSGDALAHFEDGILMRGNNAWADLFGAEQAEPGTPAMDLFDAGDRNELRTALRGKTAVKLELKVLSGDGMPVPVTVAIRPLEEPGQVELAIRSGRGQRSLAEELERAQRQDMESGLLNRAAFVETLKSASARALVLVRIDNFARIVEQMGVIGSNSVATQFAVLVRESLPADAVAGRLEGTMLGITLGDHDASVVEDWCNSVREHVSKATFDHGGRSTHLSATFGIRLPGAESDDAMLDDALAALRDARADGGNRVARFTPADDDADGGDTALSDEEWANRIKVALMKRHFRVAFQAVASLRGDTTETNDLLLRFQDPERGEILPGEFLPAAERVGLSTAIDRWVLGEAMRLLSEDAHRKRGTKLFVRLSDDSVTDPSTLKWMGTRMQAVKPEPGRLIVEISELQAETWLRDCKRLVEGMAALGCPVMLSRFGGKDSSPAMLQHLNVAWVKFDTALLTGIARDKKKQERLTELVAELGPREIRSVAPQVEDANAMAVLWQVGVDYVQGNYLQEPEVVIADG